MEIFFGLWICFVIVVSPGQSSNLAEEGILTDDTIANLLKDEVDVIDVKEPPVIQPPVRFNAHFSANQDEDCYLSAEQDGSLEKCNYNTSTKTFLVVHGWTMSGLLPGWLPKMVFALQKREPDANIIIVDWVSLAHQHYHDAVSNCKMVGKDIAQLLDWLQEKASLSLENVHIIGYSLGAHIAGYAGNYVNGTIGRITGLDPAGLGFERAEPHERLSLDDAGFVDVIHTYSRIILGRSVGIQMPIGHIDIYPNGGESQPGCPLMNLLGDLSYSNFVDTMKCEHERSIHLFVDSLVNQDQESFAFQCTDPSRFKKGICLSCRKNRCNTIGYNSKPMRTKRNSKMYLKTRAQMPYKVYHYQMKMHIFKYKEFQENEPAFLITLLGTQNDSVPLPLEIPDQVGYNFTNTFLVYTENDIGDLLTIKLKWQEATQPIYVMWKSFQSYWAKEVPSQELHVRRIRVKSGETQQKFTFCLENPENTLITPGSELDFVKCRDGWEVKKHKRKDGPASYYKYHIVKHLLLVLLSCGSSEAMKIFIGLLWICLVIAVSPGKGSSLAEEGLLKDDTIANLLKDENVTDVKKHHVKFNVHFSANPDEGCFLSPEQDDCLVNCNYNTSAKTFFVIHGWSMSGLFESWLHKLVFALQEREKDANVVVVDWMSLAHQLYPDAVNNTKAVGKDIAQLLDWLKEKANLSLETVHLIGYSLGAHVAGFAGNFVNGTVGRITGLDPAGPLFEGAEPQKRLSPDDASFVDVLHTYTRGALGVSIGIQMPIGHMDIYPNGGDYQPGCSLTEVIGALAYGGIGDAVKCEHERSVHLFVDSLVNKDKESFAFQCTDSNRFKKGICLSCRKNRCNAIGYNAKPVHTKRSSTMYLKTTAQMPYKVFHYQMKMHIFKYQESGENEPTFSVTLYGTENDSIPIPLAIPDQIGYNFTNTFLVYTENNIGDILTIKLKWDGEKQSVFNWWKSLQNYYWSSDALGKKELHVRRIRVKSGESQQKFTFCLKNPENTLITPGGELEFVKCRDGWEVKPHKRVHL
ncbi:endothelial lipase [Discoglossus pictus]